MKHEGRQNHIGCRVNVLRSHAAGFDAGRLRWLLPFGVYIEQVQWRFFRNGATQCAALFLSSLSSAEYCA
jgi:hypothetical protein